MGKRMISMPDDLLARIDEDARQRGETRSGWIQEAAMRRLRQHDADEIRARIERIRAWADDHGGSFDSTESIRAERDSR